MGGLPVIRRRDSRTLELGGILPTCLGDLGGGGGGGRGRGWFSVDVDMRLEYPHLAESPVVSRPVAFRWGKPSMCWESSKGNDLFSDDDLRDGDDTDSDTFRFRHRLDGGLDNTSSV